MKAERYHEGLERYIEDNAHINLPDSGYYSTTASFVKGVSSRPSTQCIFIS